MMEQQLAAMNWQPGDMETKLHQLENECREKNELISALHKQLEEQVGMIYLTCVLSLSSKCSLT